MDTSQWGQTRVKGGPRTTCQREQPLFPDDPSGLELAPSRSIGWPVLVLLLALAGSGDAAVRFDMFVGYDGIVPQGSWFPVAFEAQNDGPPFMATVELTPGQYNASPTRTMLFELPTSTTKRFFVPVFGAATYNLTWSARLLDDKGRGRAETSSQGVRRLHDSGVPLAAAMSRALPPLPELKSRQENLRPVFARLQPAVFPDNPITLEGLDVFYLSSERALDLKVNQIGALLAWLYGGGHLIVSLEQINHLSGSGEWLKQLLPCEVTQMTTLASHGQLQEWLRGDQRFDGTAYPSSGRGPSPKQKVSLESMANPYAKLTSDVKFEEAPMQTITVRPREGRVLIGPAATPLAIIASRGRGQITVLTFAPELEPFRTWKNGDYFWAKLIDFPPDLLASENANRYPGRPIDGVFGAMIDSRQVRKLPVGWLLLLLVAYLLVIGPLDQYWLKRLNRQMLTWLTFPAYVALFSLLIYFIGYKLRAGETEWNELHVVDVIPHGDRTDLRGRSYCSIYSPVNAKYTLAGDEPFATLRGEFSGGYGGGQESSRATVEQRENGFRAVAAVPVWTSQLFVSDWWRQAPLPVNVLVSTQEVIVDNRLEVELTAARLFVDGQVLELGQIAGGETKTFRRPGARSISLLAYVQAHSGSFQSAVTSRQRAFGDNAYGRIDDLTNAAMASSFVTQMNTQNRYNNFSPQPRCDLSSLVQRGDAVLLAWVSHYSFTKPLNQFPARRGSRDTLLRVAAVVQP